MRTLALGRADSAFYRSLRGVLSAFGSVTFRDERALEASSRVLDLVDGLSADQVLMPNPYGNEQRLACYRLLREHGVPVIASDRGALPGSWFFDHGFNADSPSYEPAAWDRPIGEDERGRAQKYITSLRTGEDALEEQGPRVSPADLRARLGIEPVEKILFLPLQRPNDTVVRYFSGSVASLDELAALAVDAVARLRAAGDRWRLVLKKHPLETTAPAVPSEHAVYAPDDAHVHDLLEASDAVIVLNSGVGLLSLLFEKPTIHVGEAFYGKPGLAVRARDADEAAVLVAGRPAPDREKVLRFLHHLLTSVYSFATFHTQKVREADGAYRRVTRHMRFRELRILGKDVPVPPARVLVVSPVIPWPIYRGSQSRVDMVLRSLIADGLDVSLSILNTSVRAPADAIVAPLRERYPELRDISVYLHPRIDRGLRRRAFRALDRATRAAHRIANQDTCPTGFREMVERACERLVPDYLFVNYAKLTPCIPDGFSGITVIDTHDYQTKFLAEDQEINGIRRWIRRDTFRESEHEALRRYDRVIAISPIEADVFREVTPESDVYLVPAFADHPTRAGVPEEPSRALFVASMSKFNVTGLEWFVAEVLPLVRRELPDFRLAVAGNIANAKQVREARYEGVDFLGIVPDLAEEYARARVVIAPLLGGAGMKIKVVEALAAGKAIACTTRAAEGIAIVHREHAFVADSPPELARGIVEIVRDDAFRHALERGALALHARDHSPEAVRAALREALA